MNGDTYRTIAQASEGIYKDKGSKFLAFAYPIESVEQVKGLVDELRARYYDARHHCFAYRVGQNGEQWRAVDDGEPSATAGKPILGQLQSMELTNLLVVVVRYFGGTKLGVSGLINAYREATIEALNAAQIEERIIESTFTVTFSYLMMNDMMKIVKDFQARIISQDFDNLCTITMSVRRDDRERFGEKLEKAGFSF